MSTQMVSNNQMSETSLQLNFSFSITEPGHVIGERMRLKYSLL